MSIKYVFHGWCTDKVGSIKINMSIDMGVNNILLLHQFISIEIVHYQLE